MARAKKQEVAPEPETVEAATEDTADNTGVPEVKETTATAPVKTEFEVYHADGGLIRVYTTEIHGDDAEKLANEFVSNHPGTVIR